MSIMLIKWQTQYKTTIDWSTYDARDLITMINKLETIGVHIAAISKVEKLNKHDKTKQLQRKINRPWVLLKF